MSPESNFKETIQVTWTWKKIESVFAYKYNRFRTKKDSVFNFSNNGGELSSTDFTKGQYIISIYGNLGIIFVLHNQLVFLGSNGFSSKIE